MLEMQKEQEELLAQAHANLPNLPSDPNTLLAMGAALFQGMNGGVMPPQLANLTPEQQKVLL